MSVLPKIHKLIYGVLASFLLMTQAVANAETYNFDPSHSYVMWHINHFGFSNPSGKWLVNGNVVLDEANPANSKVNAIIQVNNFITGIPKLDTHLRGNDFFYVTKYPVATFVSNKVEVNGQMAKVSGMLTVHGISKPIVLDVKLNKLDVSPISSKKTAGFTASTTLKRSEFGMDKYLPGLADEVVINIEAEAIKT